MPVDGVITLVRNCMIGQFARDGVGYKTRVKFVNSHWPISIRLLLVKLSRHVSPLTKENLLVVQRVFDSLLGTYKVLFGVFKAH